MFEDALTFTMMYEVGPWFKLDDETKKGLIETTEQRKKVGYVNDPADKGGETKFGVAQNFNMAVNVHDMDWEQAKVVYARSYWIPGLCQNLSGNLAFAHFDACVNHGVKKAIQLLQRAVNVKDDGVFGPGTMAAINQMQAKVDVVQLQLQARKKFMSDIVAANPTQQKFLKGWLARCDAVSKALA